MDPALEKIIEFTDKAHGEQMRKYTPERYIVHPVRVMKTCKKYTDDLPVLAAAILHDVLEDTPVTKHELERFLSTVMDDKKAKRTVSLVVELTDVFVWDAYPRMNRKKRKEKEMERLEKTSPDSQTIKYADIIDNCNEIVEHDRDFAKVFLNECKRLLKKIPKGNQELYRKAVELVDDRLSRLRG